MFLILEPFQTAHYNDSSSHIESNFKIFYFYFIDIEILKAGF